MKLGPIFLRSPARAQTKLEARKFQARASSTVTNFDPILVQLHQLILIRLKANLANPLFVA